MKTFEQYIDEAYNFRLGGSQQKGFEQTKVKTFSELERGDDIYTAHIDGNKLSFSIVRTVERVIEPNKNEDFPKYKINCTNSKNVNIEEEYANSSVSFSQQFFNGMVHITINSTNEDEFKDEIRKVCKGHIFINNARQ